MSHGLALPAATLFALLALTCSPIAPPAAPRNDTAAAPAQITGQWIWTRADADLFARAREKHPDLEASVLGATIGAGPRGLALHRGLSPAYGGEHEPVALVVRIEDSLHALWDVRGVDGIAADLGVLLARVLEEARATGAPITELELDYDAPERRLGAWSEVVARLADRELAGVPLWVTSIPTHLDDPEYGARLVGHVRGHILQLFDTGLSCTPAEIQHIRAVLMRQGLPFRLGVGVFERAKRGRRTTDHGAWFDAVAGLRDVPGFSGVWVFPAGRDYETRLASLLETAR